MKERLADKPVFGVIVVVLVVVIAVSILSFVDAYTKPKREAYKRQKLTSSLTQACPMKGLTFPDEPETVSWNGTSWEVFKGRDSSGQVRCVAIVTESKKGYGGEIRLLLGVDSEGRIAGVVVLEHYETPGLGDRITTEEFRRQFIGRSLRDTAFKVRKDGGDIQQITSATISSRAFCEAVEKGLKLFQAKRSELIR